MRRALLLGAVALLAVVPLAAAKTFDDPHGTITVRAGSAFTVALPVTPGTGYSWQLTRKPDPTVVRYLGSKTTSGGGPGSPGEQLLRFRAGDGGRTAMTLSYVGPGRDAPVAKRRALAVKVR
jgi:predicted secreted protein